jgi:hypothetical protein
MNVEATDAVRLGFNDARCRHGQVEAVGHNFVGQGVRLVGSCIISDEPGDDYALAQFSQILSQIEDE